MDSCTVIYMNLTDSQKREFDRLAGRSFELGLRIVNESPQAFIDASSSMDSFQSMLDEFEHTVNELKKVHSQLVNNFCEATYN